MRLQPTAMVAGGDAIARDDDGRVVFVAGALPGEQVEVEVVKRKRDYAKARVLEVVDPSPLRRAVPCPEVARGCGGCQWQHVTLDGQRALKRDIVLDALRRQGRLDTVELATTVALPGEAYRTSIRAAVTDGRAGYRGAGSHDITAVGSCAVAHPLLEDLLVNGRFAGATEVVLRCGSATGERVAVPTPSDVAITVAADVRRDHFHEVVAGRRWRISAPSFFQSRTDGAEALTGLVLAAAAAASGGGAPRRAGDLYSGVGLFAGALADRGWSVTAVEGSAASVADARVNLADDACTIVQADVNGWSPIAADVVVADPSRNGLGRDGVATVAGTAAGRVILVSCDAAALGRDARLLIDAGYTLASVTPVDMFPNTFHIEVVSVFDRR
jgi:23S rRNA (uracil1939-C5)-methyltransferase